MRKFLVLLLFALTVAGAVNAQMIIGSTAFTLDTSDDTMVAIENNTLTSGGTNNIPFGTCLRLQNFTRDLNYGNCSLIIDRWQDNTGEVRGETYFKFNVSSLLRKVITNLVQVSYGKLSQSGGAPTNGIFFARHLGYSLNDTWSELVVNGSEHPALVTQNLGITIPASTFPFSQTYGTPNIMSAPIFADTVYTDSNGILTFGYNSTAISGSTGATYMSTKEAGTPTQLIGTYADFYAVTVQSTDVAGDVYFDFESLTASITAFSQADFVYHSTTNTMDVFQPAVFDSTSLEKTFRLNQIACARQDPFFAVTTQNGVGAGQPENADSDVICFQLVNEHGGKPFYGAMQIINVTNVRGAAAKEFDFFAALYSPDFATFTSPTFNPQPPQIFRNLSVSWTSSQALTSNLRFRFVSANGTASGYNTLNGNTSVFNTVHTLVINKADITHTDGHYEIQFFGSNQNASGATSLSSNFTASQHIPDIEDLTEGIQILVRTERNIPLEADCAFSYLETDPANTRFNQTVTVATHTAQFPVNETGGFEEVCGIAGNIIGFRNFTLTVSAPDYLTKVINLTAATNPFFQIIRMTPSNTCFKFGTSSTSAECEADAPDDIALLRAQSGINITSWYCKFEVGACNIFDTAGNPTCGVPTSSGGTFNTIEGGLWDAFFCIDGFHPSGFPVNGSLAKGQLFTNDTSDVVTPAFDLLGSFFGVSGGDFRTMIALVISVIIMGGLAAWSKSGVVGLGAFFAMLTVFTVFEWLPIWILFVLVLVAGGFAAMLGNKLFGNKDGN